MCDDDFLDLRCLLRGCRPAPRPRYKILYAGTDHALSKALRAELTQMDCLVDYCPDEWLAQALLASEIAYALVLCADLRDAPGAALAAYARTLKHRTRMPCLVLQATDDCAVLAQRIRHFLATIKSPAQHTFAP